jgi:hypothetical protein
MKYTKFLQEVSQSLLTSSILFGIGELVKQQNS